MQKIEILRKLPLSCLDEVLSNHITNQKLSFDVFTIGNSLNIFMEQDLYLIS